MARITIGLMNPSETEKTTMVVPDDVPVGMLTDAVVRELRMPLRGNDGRRLRYRVATDGEGGLKELNPSRTLEDLNVGEGAVLRLNVEVVAG